MSVILPTPDEAEKIRSGDNALRAKYYLLNYEHKAALALYAVRPLGRTGCLERKRKANTIGLAIMAMSGSEEWGLVPHSEFMVWNR